MGTTYKHLRSEERAVIMIERRRGRSFRAIAGLLSRDVSTISREVARDGAAVAYDATRAAAAYRERRRRCVRRRTLVEGTALFEHVHNRLRYWRWSPAQIARRLARMHADDPQ